MNDRWLQILVGDCRGTLRGLPPASVHLVCTSPPYLGLRDYAHEQQIGLERTVEHYARELVAVFAECKRILHPTGTCWVNLGDCYQNGSLSMLPFVVAEAMKADGWRLRQWIPWLKRNAMPESAAKLRPGSQLETWLVFDKGASPPAYYDWYAVRRGAATTTIVRAQQMIDDQAGSARANGGTRPDRPMRAMVAADDRRMFRNGDLILGDLGEILVFDVPVMGNTHAHFASYPERLIEPVIRAATSAHGVCASCGAPWIRVIDSERVATRPGDGSKVHGRNSRANRSRDAKHPHETDGKAVDRGKRESLAHGNRDPERHVTHYRHRGWAPGCECRDAGEPIPATVLDPFGGTGTTAAAANRLGRRAILCELNPDYAAIAEQRLERSAPSLFHQKDT